jgi:toxin ParE1/3/4
LKKFTINIEPEAFEDIQKAVDYYNGKQVGLGKRFYNTVDKHFNFLKKNYTAFAVRYDDIRCMNVDKFPYSIHYQILAQQQVVGIKAVFCTYQNPEKWEDRIK